ncbi:hypothetical protein NDU88_005203 [Pleurodeles waltl]|uniref:Uncharacterized protein n=1 Tax=Pleurodeles waltl TaxID=8319 RepID=A0AAV7TA52_PLEWA|nr:hypothetical protein NDU88_005203 [Pleurodeles waltl]
MSARAYLRPARPDVEKELGGAARYPERKEAVSRYEDGQGKEVKLSEGREEEFWEGEGNALGTNNQRKRIRAQGH